jgi:hypothetical protein
VARSYLTVEFRKMSGSGSTTIAATSVFFGLRMEF